MNQTQGIIEVHSQRAQLEGTGHAVRSGALAGAGLRGLFGAVLLGAATLGSMAAHAEDVLGVSLVDGMYRLRTLSAQGVVSEVGVMPTFEGGRIGAAFSDGEEVHVAHAAAPRSGVEARVHGLGPAAHPRAGAEWSFVMPADAGTVAGVAATPGTGTFTALVSHRGDTPPYAVARYRVGRGGSELLDQMVLPGNARYANLAACASGTLYSVSAGASGNYRLVKLDLDAHALQPLVVLKWQGAALQREPAGLVCGGDGRLLALADPSDTGHNGLYRIDAASGVMTLVAPFDVERLVTGPMARN